MKTIDAFGKPCPVPVIETKKSLAEHDVDSVIVKVDNIIAVQNLEKMAKGYGYNFSYVEKANDSYEALINKDGENPPQAAPGSTLTSGLAVVISRDTMGDGAAELGKILLKGFIYSLTELPVPPRLVAFLNSGAYLTSAEANTIDDLKALEAKGTEILTCGTCINYYKLKEKPAVGSVANMYEITERMAAADSVINI